MKALKENGFRVPEPVAQSRHTIVMELVDAFPLRQIVEVPDPAGLYAELLEMVVSLAGVGLIHGDFNEFNILIKEEKVQKGKEGEARGNEAESDDKEPEVVLTPVLIDFPQMVSIDHPNAAMYFDRDVNCVKRFFERRFHFTSDDPGPFFADVRKTVGKSGVKRLDVEAEASGFSRKMAKELEAYMKEVGVDGDGGEGRESGSEGEEPGSEDDSAKKVEDEESEKIHAKYFMPLGLQGLPQDQKSPDISSLSISNQT